MRAAVRKWPEAIDRFYSGFQRCCDFAYFVRCVLTCQRRSWHQVLCHVEAANDDRLEPHFSDQPGSGFGKRKDSDLGQNFGDFKAVGKVLRGKRGTFIADENVAPFRSAARAKSFPAPTTTNEGPYFVPRLTTERTVAPRLGGAGRLGVSIFLRRSLNFSERNLHLSLGR